MRLSRLGFLTVVAAVCCGTLVTLELTQPFPYQRLQNLCRDALARVGRTTAANPDLVFLAIDSESAHLLAEDAEIYGSKDPSSIEARAFKLMTKSWPWPREIYALLLERLVNAGAKVVLLDLTFDAPTAGDAPFRDALERYRDRVVLGSNFVAANLHGLQRGAPSYARPTDALIPQTKPTDDRVAYTNFWPDEDDVVRRAQFRVTFDQLEDRLARPESEIFLSLAARGLMKSGRSDALPAGTDDRLFRYTAPPRQGFAPHSIFEIFVPDYWQHNYKNGEFFRDKIVLVGAEGNWQHDEHPTPFGSMPGPEVHLNAMNAALHGEFLREVPWLGLIALDLLAAGAAVALSLRVRSPWWRLAVLVAMNLGAAAGALAAFNWLALDLPVVGATGLLDLVAVVGLMSDFARERAEKSRVRRTLERYVSHNVVREILDHPKLYAEALGGVIKPVSILFSDIRGYSTVSARTDPQALVAQLNEYLTAMVDCVFRHGGTLDKFIGDAVMAVWGNTLSEGVREDATNAVRAALEMKSELARLNRSWRERGLPELRIGLAINHGPVVVGNIGSEQRMEFTVVGDAVNTSWKLQEMTKTLGWDLLVGEKVAALIVEDFELRSFGSIAVRDGAPMEVFGVVEEIRMEQPTRGAADFATR